MNIKLVFFKVVFLLTLVLPMAFLRAQDVSPVAANKAELQKQLADVQKQIDDQTAILNEKQRESVTLERDIDILNAQISKSKLQIKAFDLTLQQLSSQINDKSNTIDDLAAKIEREKESLAQILRKTSKMDDYTLPEVALSDKNLSSFFEDVNSFTSIKSALKDSFITITNDKNQTQTEKDSLEEKKTEESELKSLQMLEQKRIQQQTAEKQNILKVSKGVEAAYQKMIATNKKTAASIRSALFALRDSAAIPFGDAYNYALEVEKKTGIRPAFLLAILTQETNLGENVGQCLVTNFTTGDGVGKNTGTFFKAVMKPGRDIQPFLDLANRLGFDPKTRPVSCPQVGGYGGAMGPSQFLPSTWHGIESRITSLTGVSLPDPWIAHDAFFASGIYLADLGASGSSYTSEYTAAAKYYAGGSWKTRGQGYALSVMTHANNIQENMIDRIQNL